MQHYGQTITLSSYLIVQILLQHTQAASVLSSKLLHANKKVKTALHLFQMVQNIQNSPINQIVNFMLSSRLPHWALRMHVWHNNNGLYSVCHKQVTHVQLQLKK